MVLNNHDLSLHADAEQPETIKIKGKTKIKDMEKIANATVNLFSKKTRCCKSLVFLMMTVFLYLSVLCFISDCGIKQDENSYSNLQKTEQSFEQADADNFANMISKF